MAACCIRLLVALRTASRPRAGIASSTFRQRPGWLQRFSIEPWNPPLQYSRFPINQIFQAVPGNDKIAFILLILNEISVSDKRSPSPIRNQAESRFVTTPAYPGGVPVDRRWGGRARPATSHPGEATSFTSSAHGPESGSPATRLRLRSLLFRPRFPPLFSRSASLLSLARSAFAGETPCFSCRIAARSTQVPCECGFCAIEHD